MKVFLSICFLVWLGSASSVFTHDSGVLKQIRMSYGVAATRWDCECELRIQACSTGSTACYRHIELYGLTPTFQDIANTDGVLCDVDFFANRFCGSGICDEEFLPPSMSVFCPDKEAIGASQHAIPSSTPEALPAAAAPPPGIQI
jgi:hypothetical protein